MRCYADNESCSEDDNETIVVDNLSNIIGQRIMGDCILICQPQPSHHFSTVCGLMWLLLVLVGFIRAFPYTTSKAGMIAKIKCPAL